ncbi:MAG: DUF192 domain-containing protein [Hyphomicrobiaceae bacterium]
MILRNADLQMAGPQQVNVPAAREPAAPHVATAPSALTLVTASGRHPITLEIADTDQKRMVGLMFRTSLPFGHGMLFPYGSEQEITMWMKNTYVSLDMVFIRRDGTVLRVARNTEPMSEAIIASQGPAYAVLELVAGSADRYRIEPGSRIEHALFATPAER